MLGVVEGGKSGLAGKPLILKGLYPATITPFSEDFSVDWPTLEKHLRITAEAAGVEGLAVNGGVAELLQLTLAEQARAIEIACKVRRPGQPIIAGIWGNGPAQAVEAGLNAKRAGADALLVLPPFDIRAYRRLAADKASVHAFFAELDRKVDLPMVVFQYPPQSGSAYPVPVLEHISSIRNVVAIKAASATDAVYAELWDALKDKVAVLAAVDSPPLFDMFVRGSHGALIGISAIGPERWARIMTLIDDGRTNEARALFDSFARPLMKSVFQNQQPVHLSHEAATMKEALVQMGEIPSSRVRPPAIGVDDAIRAEIRESLIAAGLIAADGLKRAAG